MSATQWLPQLVALSLVGVLLASAFVPPWEFFHDELYYWAGAQRFQWIVSSFTGYGWSRNRGLSGEAAIIGFYEDWEEVAAELFEIHPGPKIRIVDPHDDWSDALARIHANVRGDP